MSGVSLASAKKNAITNSRGAATPGKCPNCVKQNGLAILPLVSGLLPNGLLPANVVGIPETLQVNASLRTLSNALSAADLGHHWYYMRALPSGYLYLLLPDDTWQAYLVDRSGLLRAMPPLDMPSPAESVEPLDQTGACLSPEHNPVALQFIVLDPEKTPTVWMAFSRYRWSQQVLDDYRENKDDSRSKRMSSIDVQAAAKGQVGKGKTVPNGNPMATDLGRHVADYASQEVRDLIDSYSLEPLHARGAGIVPVPAVVPTRTATLVAEMAAVSKNTPLKNGVFLVLDDVVGHAMQLNYLRNRTAAELSALTGMGDPEKMRRRVIAEMIEGIRHNAELNPGPLYARHFGPDRYLKHIDQAAWRNALQENAEEKNLKQVITLTSKDFVTVLRSKHWQQQQRTDFSATPASALAHEKMVACCLAGSGQEPSEQPLWDDVMALPAHDPDNWLTRALGGQHIPFMDYLEQSPGDQDDAYGGAKEALGLTTDFLGKGVLHIDRMRTVIRARRAANANTAILIETSAGHLFRLRRQNPKAYRKLVRQVTLALITRDDIVPQPTLLTGTWQQITQKWMAVLLGDPRVQAQAPVTVTQGSTLGLSELRKPALSGAVQGALILAPPATSGETATAVAWVVSKIDQGGQLDHELARKLKLTEARITAQAAAKPTQGNPMLKNQLTRMGLQADAVLGAGAVFFQAMAGANVLNDFAKVQTPGVKEYAELTVSLTYSVLGTLGAGLEALAAVQTLSGSKRVTVQTLARMGARLGLTAGVIEGAYTIVKGAQKYSAGDKDSGYWSVGSGTAFAITSLASYGLVTTTAAAGAGTTVSGLFGLMGPAGWLLLFAAALGIALYCAWQAFATDDENLLPVEYWLDNGIFGKGAYRSGERASKNPFAHDAQVKSFASFEEEVMALNRLLLVAQASFDYLRSEFAGIGRYQIDLPRYAKGSRLEVEFHAYGKDGKRLKIGELHCEDGNDKLNHYQLSERLTGLHPYPKLLVDKTLGTARIEGQFATTTESGGALRDTIVWLVERISGREVPDALYAESLGMTLKYWPNRKELPTLVSEFSYPAPRT